MKSRKKVKLPTLFYNGEAWLKISDIPSFQIYTDKVLSVILQVTPMIINSWRKSGKIPFTMFGKYAQYDVNKVIEALLQNGYESDETLKNCKYEIK